jgi:hypothetical protein
MNEGICDFGFAICDLDRLRRVLVRTKETLTRPPEFNRRKRSILTKDAAKRRVESNPDRAAQFGKQTESFVPSPSFPSLPSVKRKTTFVS